MPISCSQTALAVTCGQKLAAIRMIRGPMEDVGVELSTGVGFELVAGFILRHGDAVDSGEVLGVALGQNLRGEATREGRVLDRLHLHRVGSRAALELDDHEVPVIVQSQQVEPIGGVPITRLPGAELEGHDADAAAQDLGVLAHPLLQVGPFTELPLQVRSVLPALREPRETP